MNQSKPKSMIVISIIVFLIGLMMLGYWTKYIIDGLPLKSVPIASEGIAAILSIITGIGLFQMRKWSFVSCILVSGFWMYGCIGGINMVVYNLIVQKQLGFQSPVGAWTDAILFIVITGWAAVLVMYMWKMRKTILND
jgi:hypothetical protein